MIEESHYNYRQNKIGNQRFFTSLKFRNQYIEEYNRTTKSCSSIVAYSTLINICIELKGQFDKIDNDLNEILEWIYNFIDIPDQEDGNLYTASETVKIDLTTTFPVTNFYSVYQVTKADLLDDLRSFTDTKQIKFTNAIPYKVDKLFDIKEKQEQLFPHIHALDGLIDEILKKEYPYPLKEVSESEYKTEFNKAGRTELVSEEEIKPIILSWAKKAKAGEGNFARLIWDTPKRKGEFHISKFVVKLKQEGFIDENLYKNDKSIRDKVSKILSENWK